jgi:hypothetical protein
VFKRLPVLVITALVTLPSVLPADNSDTSAEGRATSIRDPFQPPGYREPTASASEERFDPDVWQLVTTMVSGKRRSAIINGRNVREGGDVGGATVLEIHNGRVDLEYRGRQFTIRTQTPSVRLHERGGDGAR